MKSLAIIAWISMALLLSACGDKKSAATNPASESEAPKARPMSQEVRDAIVGNATKGLTLQRDKVAGTSTYSPPRQEVMLLLKDRLSAYVSLPDGRLPTLHMYLFYAGDDWLFLERVKVISDGEIVYERAFDHSLIKRDIHGTGVWETVDYPAKDKELVAIRKIASAKKTSMRFYGNSDSRQEDHDASPGEVESLKLALTAYEQLSATLK